MVNFSNLTSTVKIRTWRDSTKEKDSSRAYELLSTRPIPWYYSKKAIFGVFCVIIILLFLQLFYADELPNPNQTPPFRNGLPNPPATNYSECPGVESRVDCHPGPNANKEMCEARGCCWIEPNSTLLNVPTCFYPYNFHGYKYVKNSNIMERIFKSPYPNDILKLNVTYSMIHGAQRIRVTPAAPFPERYETPFPFINGTEEEAGPQLTLNDAHILTDVYPSADLIYSEQFIEYTIPSPPGVKLYGIGERDGRLQIDPSLGWQKTVLFNADQPPTANRNLYGSHPFILGVLNNVSYGFLMLNSNAMEIIVFPSGLTFRMLGGIVDIIFFKGQTPEDVIKKYVEIVGRPFMPPLWGLGFHLCRFGTRTLNNTKEIYFRNKNAGIPIDVQWNDLDYMKNSNDFTYDDTTFKGLPEFVNELHQNGVHWVPLIDAGVSASEPAGTYLPFDSGLKDDIFVKNSEGELFVGKVWNRVSTVWPDFTHPDALTYWKNLLVNLFSVVPFDGVWLDMNEPSNFYNGASDGCKGDLDYPPYVPDVNGGLMFYKTLCMNAKQFWGSHYNLHNIYGATEVWITNNALSLMSDKRPFIISRSSFVGLGQYGGHWSGDVFSTWEDLKKSIPEMLSFSMFGIPLMGADICGFNGNTTEELCARWYQLGAFYPFSRSHNTDDAIAQDPTALGDLVLNAARNSLLTRYSLLSYLYTLFYKAHVNGTTVARPVFFEFPNDPNTLSLDQQFLWGPSLMIVPVLDPGVSNFDAYLPKGRWYDFYIGSMFDLAEGQNVTLDGSINNNVSLFIRGGRIITRQKPELTSKLTIKNPLELMVGLNENNQAFGEVYFDDGVTNSVNGSFFVMSCDSKQLLVTQVTAGYDDIPKVEKVTVYGRQMKPTSMVLINGKEVKSDYDVDKKVMKIYGFLENLGGLQIVWT